MLCIKYEINANLISYQITLWTKFGQIFLHFREALQTVEVYFITRYFRGKKVSLFGDFRNFCGTQFHGWAEIGI